MDLSREICNDTSLANHQCENESVHHFSHVFESFYASFLTSK